MSLCVDRIRRAGRRLEADSMVQLPQVGGLNGGGADWRIHYPVPVRLARLRFVNNLTAGMALQSMALPLPACCRMRHDDAAIARTPTLPS